VTQPNEIFAPEVHQLHSCRLRPLGANEAMPLSTVFADMDPWKTLGYQREQLASYLLLPDPALKRFTVLVAKERSGIVCLRHPWLRGPFLEMLALFPSCQGRGLGKEILQWIEDQTKIFHPNIWVTVSAFNSGARRFYKQAGFLQVAVLSGLVRDGFDELLLRKLIHRD
jgi:diamine N-acetyltransferase